MSEIVLVHPNHGTFRVDADSLQKAVEKYGSASEFFVREQTCGHVGFPMPDKFLGVTALDDCSVIECLIIWVESGNFVF